MELSMDVVLLRSPSQPLHSFCAALLHALAIVVTGTQMVFSLAVFLLGGFAKPLYRLHLILQHALAIGIAETESILGGCITFFCLRFCVFEQFAIWVASLRRPANSDDCNRQSHGEERHPFPFHVGRLVRSN